MRKVNILLIFTISLFFFSFTSVKAATTIIDQILTEEDFGYINEDFLHFRSKAIEYVNNNYSGYYYVIRYDTKNNFYTLGILTEVDDTTTIKLERMGIEYFRYYVRSRIVYYKLVNDNLVEFSNSSQYSEIFYLRSTFYFNGYLDSNFDMYTDEYMDYWEKITLKYNDKSFYYSSNIKAPTVYELYQYFEVGNYFDSHEEEKNILLNYFVVVIDSLKYICNVFVSNYIYLSMIVIIIFVIVVELVRRLL